MAPRTGPRVKVISPNSGTVTTLSRSVSLASSAYSSAPASPTSSFQRRNAAGGQQQAHHRHEVGEEKSDRRPFVTPHGAPPPQSGRAVLHAIGINTYSAAAQRGKGGEAAPRRPAPSSPAPPSLSHRTATPQGRTIQGGSSAGNEAQPSGLPNYFDEAAQRRATRAAPTRPAPTSFSSASRSISRGLPTHEQRARSRAEDDEAIHRARAALEHAGDAVLRRPFSSLNSSSATHSKYALNTTTTTTTTSSGNRSNVSTSTLLGGNTSALPLRVSAVSPGSKHKGMRLPPSIPITRGDISASDVDSEEEDGFDRSYRGGSRQRQRSWAAEATENAAALARRRTERTNEATSASSASFHHGDSGDTTQSFLASRHVCPGMFAGVSAISLNPRLFDGMEYLGAAGSSSSAASPSSARSKHAGGVGGRVQQRYCVRPLWSLVGTFKTSLTGLVSVDLQQDCLRWLQRNPKGGQQCIKVPLSLILDVFTTKVVLEDESVEERQFTVVVRTSTRPSQVVFGFAAASEANHMCAVLKRPSS